MGILFEDRFLNFADGAEGPKKAAEKSQSQKAGERYEKLKDAEGIYVKKVLDEAEDNVGEGLLAAPEFKFEESAFSSRPEFFAAPGFEMPINPKIYPGSTKGLPADKLLKRVDKIEASSTESGFKKNFDLKSKNRQKLARAAKDLQTMSELGLLDTNSEAFYKGNEKLISEIQSSSKSLKEIQEELGKSEEEIFGPNGVLNFLIAVDRLNQVFSVDDLLKGINSNVFEKDSLKGKVSIKTGQEKAKSGIKWLSEKGMEEAAVAADERAKAEYEEKARKNAEEENARVEAERKAQEEEARMVEMEGDIRDELESNLGVNGDFSLFVFELKNLSADGSDVKAVIEMAGDEEFSYNFGMKVVRDDDGNFRYSLTNVTKAEKDKEEDPVDVDFSKNDYGDLKAGELIDKLLGLVESFEEEVVERKLNEGAKKILDELVNELNDGLKGKFVLKTVDEDGGAAFEFMGILSEEFLMGDENGNFSLRCKVSKDGEDYKMTAESLVFISKAGDETPLELYLFPFEIEGAGDVETFVETFRENLGKEGVGEEKGPIPREAILDALQNGDVVEREEFDPSEPDDDEYSEEELADAQAALARAGVDLGPKEAEKDKDFLAELNDAEGVQISLEVDEENENSLTFKVEDGKYEFSYKFVATRKKTDDGSFSYEISNVIKCTADTCLKPEKVDFSGNDPKEIRDFIVKFINDSEAPDEAEDVDGEEPLPAPKPDDSETDYAYEDSVSEYSGDGGGGDYYEDPGGVDADTRIPDPIAETPIEPAAAAETVEEDVDSLAADSAAGVLENLKKELKSAGRNENCILERKVNDDGTIDLVFERLYTFTHYKGGTGRLNYKLKIKKNSEGKFSLYLDGADVISSDSTESIVLPGVPLKIPSLKKLDEFDNSLRASQTQEMLTGVFRVNGVNGLKVEHSPVGVFNHIFNVSFVRNGKEYKFRVEANPMSRKIKIAGEVGVELGHSGEFGKPLSEKVLDEALEKYEKKMEQKKQLKILEGQLDVNAAEAAMAAVTETGEYPQEIDLEEVEPKNLKDYLQKSSKKTVVIYGAEWCGPCKGVKKVLTKLKSEKPDINFVYVNVDKGPGPLKSLGYLADEGIPQTVSFDAGQTESKGFILGSKDSNPHKMEAYFKTYFGIESFFGL